MVTISIVIIILTFLIGTELINESKEMQTLEEHNWILKKQIESSFKENRELKLTIKRIELEKEQDLEELEREKFNQLHEMALLLDESYHVLDSIYRKAELYDYLIHRANRKQRRDFIETARITLEK